MRTLVNLIVLGAAVCAFGQTKVDLNQQRPSAIVQVERDSIGANMVRISILEPRYPVDILKHQVEQIGIESGSSSRGTQISDDPIDPAKPAESRLLKAVFAVDGLIDRKGTWLRIGPLVKALAGAPSPYQLENLQIDYDYEKPTAQDLGDYHSPAVDVTRRIVDRSIEYSVQLHTQDPTKLDLPDFAAPAVKVEVSTPTPKTDWLIVGTIGVAVVAIGALVYCLFILNPASPKKFRT